MGFKLKRLKKQVTRTANRLNPFKQPKVRDESPRGSAMVKRMRKRMGGEGYIQAQTEQMEPL